MARLKGLSEESLFFLKRTWQDSLGLQSCIWTNQKTSRTMPFEQTRPKWRCLAIMHSVTFGENLKNIIKTNTSYQKSSMLVEGWWFWACFVATGPGDRTVIESTVNYSVYQSILESNLRPFIWQLKLGQNWVIQQDNDPKHTSKSTAEQLKK